MRGLLIGISEVVQGETYPLDQQEILIGGTSASTLRIPHPSVSREHCLIRVQDDCIEIHDQGSHNGTFVNGLPVRDRVLLDEDELMIGAVLFLFRTLESGTIGAANPGTAEPSFSDTMGEINVPLAREAHTLARIGEVARLVQSIYLNRADPHSDDARLLLAAIFEMIPSRRGALLLFVEGHEERRLLAEYADSPESAVTIPDAAIDQLLERRSAISGREERDGVARVSAAGFRPSGRSAVSRFERCTPRLRHAGRAHDPGGVRRARAGNRERARSADAASGERAPACGDHAGRRLDRRERRAHYIAGRHSESGANEHHGVDTRRERYGERTGGAGHSSQQPAQRASFRSGELRRDCGNAARKRVFRSRERRFTGAAAQRKGRFETADGGTVFLDEIGELGLPLQAKLLRVLQEREFERVGGSRPVKVDIRVVAATNRDLENAIRVGTFREDLFYRLNVVPLRIPPLRERREDILVLAAHFARKFSEQVGRPVNGFTREARALLAAYDWPGNVRELQNVIERAVVMGSSDAIVPDDLPEVLLDATQDGETEGSGFHASVRQHRRRIILAALERAGGNVAEAARALKLHPVYLHRLITSLGLRQS